jgi:hypothetical protein
MVAAPVIGSDGRAIGIDGPAGRGRGVDRRGGGDGEEGQRVYESAAEIERAMMAYEVAMR